MSEAYSLSAVVAGGTDDLSPAVAWVRLTPDAQVLDASNLARNLMANPDAPVHIRSDRLEALDREDRSRVTKMLRRLGEESRAAAVTAVRGLEATWLLKASLAGGVVTLTILPLSSSLRAEFVGMNQLFGLTPTEHDLLLRLLDGASATEIAQDTGKALMTVRTHLKRVYAKAGVSSKEQLFSSILRVALALR